MEKIEIIGARIHNLKNIDVSIPKHKIIAITGVSGSGKSSLAFDLLFEEGMTRYLHAIGLPPRLETEKQFDMITGLSPTIAVEQRTVRYKNPRSTVGTRTGIYNYLRMLYATEAKRLCPICKEPVSKNFTCEICGMEADPLEMKNFSFNEPSGMCLKCAGRGYIREFRPEKLIPNENWTLEEICKAASGSFAALKRWVPCLADHYGFNPKTPYKDLPKKIQDIFLYGSSGEKIVFQMESKQYTHVAKKEYEGIIPNLERAIETSVSDYRRKKIENSYMDKVICTDCKGFRINEQAREATISEKHIGELATITIDELLRFLENIDENELKYESGRALLAKIVDELKKFELIGLSYLHLNRSNRSLSGGEVQRLSLLTQMSLGLGDVVLILDEPTMGMHELEKESLGKILEVLRDQGNTVIIVEHDEKLISIADDVIDLGPGAGVLGGEIVFQGTLAKLKNDPKSLTGEYLGKKIEYPKKTQKMRRKLKPGKIIQLTDVSTNNLQNVTVDIPLGLMVGVSGVSGSGKSSLITDTLVPLLQKQLKYAKKQEKKAESEEIYDYETKDPLEIVKGKLDGWENIDECIVVDQSPIGRNRNSFPASYIGLWDVIRKLFAKQPVSKKRKYKDGRFSFNSEKGRCPVCKGEGRITLQISFLDELSVPCEECNGKRYISEILEVTYFKKNIREVLDLSVSDALEVFKEEPKIMKYLKILEKIGMGYIRLGQSATTLSGGEAQRIKLSKALGSSKHKNTLFVLDEPTTGLHFHDEVKLLKLLDQLVDQGNSVVIIEHNTNILSYCDWIIELGPKGGPKGGKIISEGTPEEVMKNTNSIIGEFLI